jgi:hypothetical protein
MPRGLGDLEVTGDLIDALPLTRGGSRPRE